MDIRPTGVYVQTNENGHITAIGSDLFLPDLAGWQRIDEGFGERYDHAQGQYLPNPVFDEEGRSNWKLEDGKPVERTQEEKDADYTPPEIVPNVDAGSLAAEVAALRESNAQLQEALEILLSGRVDSDG